MTTVKLVDLGDVLRRDLKEITETELTRLHAQVAREEKQRVIDEAGMQPGVETYVDGRRGVSEDEVRPFGMIAYWFTYWDEIARFAIEQAELISPRKTGRYLGSWFFIADEIVFRDPDQIPSDTRRLILTNDQPYHRKIHVGSMQVHAPGQAAIVETVRKQVNARFGNSVKAGIEFVDLGGDGSGLASETPWRLRRQTRRVNRTGRNISGVVNYPALVMTVI